ncbi:hypothetical protein NCAST_32_08310 [Nocardia asteroides NBRC 15531]|uniref:Uncharacterized protein n=1 Tax=Nocardia asteroides NBRC 15531 TaxID=1110697 RepID=U5EMN3_NOCAS|nr:hypothetical protein NCAST_32_08310 [Nocardia asteroides NBRC 15531]
MGTAALRIAMIATRIRSLTAVRRFADGLHARSLTVALGDGWPRVRSADGRHARMRMAARPFLGGCAPAVRVVLAVPAGRARAVWRHWRSVLWGRPRDGCRLAGG